MRLSIGRGHSPTSPQRHPWPRCMAIIDESLTGGHLESPPDSLPSGHSQGVSGQSPCACGVFPCSFFPSPASSILAIWVSTVVALAAVYTRGNQSNPLRRRPLAQLVIQQWALLEWRGGASRKVGRFAAHYGYYLVIGDGGRVACGDGKSSSQESGGIA